MKNLNARFMHEKLKRGWTAEKFAQHLGVSEEQFYAILKETFKEKAACAMIKQLKKNGKKPSTEEQTEHATTVVVEEAIDDTESSSTDAVDGASNEISPLTILKAREEELSRALNDKELYHKAIVSERRDLFELLGSYKWEMEKILQKAIQYQNNIRELISSIDESSEKMHEINIDAETIRKELYDVKKQIKELSKVSIFVYENGLIEFDADTSFQIEIPDDWEDLALVLSQNELLEELTIRQIKRLAKTINLSRELRRKKVEHEIVFESEIVQRFFEQFR